VVATPDSPEAAFCVVRGLGDREPLLERTAAELVQSVDALGFEEMRIAESKPYLTRMYVPVIVTAAALQLCRFDPSELDMETGKLPTDFANFESVPFVRFRKALGGVRDAAWATHDAHDTLQAVHRENERSVLIVQAKSLKRLLDEWKLSQALGESFPHAITRRANAR